MSPKTTSTTTDKTDPTSGQWVEIIEPKSKQRIYANLETGICAKNPPEGATVCRSEDFSDHWWELYDQKTGKYYYYNPEQQKTAWTKPTESLSSKGDARKLLIIPVSRLQTFKRLSSNVQNVEKCSVATQTVASNLVSTGTQTLSGSVLEDEFSTKLKFIDLSNDSSKSFSSCTHSSSTSRSHLNHRQSSDFNSRDRHDHLDHHFLGDAYRQQQHVNRNSELSSNEQQNKSSQNGTVNNQRNCAGYGNEDNFLNYFPPPSQHQKDPIPISIQSPGSKYTNPHPYPRTDDYLSSTSTFGNPARPPISSHSNNKQPQKMTTNNLSHYLVREARAMGIALISDDEIDEDDQDSEDDCVVDDDEDTDLRDDSSSHRGAASDLNASEDLGEDSSEGWKSLSDQDSPNGTSTQTKPHQMIQKSPIHCETSASFTFNELIDDEKDPASCMSQQLDHRKLVENFKKSRQTLSFGLHDSLGRSHKSDHPKHSAQRTKTVNYNFINNEKAELQASDRHLRQLSTLSTLPRPNKATKDKVALSKQVEESSGNIDADYDVVEENCGYFSDSEQLQSANQFELSSNSVDRNKKISSSKVTGESKSPNSHFDRNKSSRGSTFSVESFARENLTRHPKKGGLLFNRKVKWSRMISWTKSSIKQPMISSVSSDLYTDSIASFKLIQQFMGDRKVTMTKRYRHILAQSGLNEDYKDSHQSKVKNLARSGSINAGAHSANVIGNNSSNNIVPTSMPDRLRDELAYELVIKGCLKSALRDEIYVQMARQLTENPSQDSISWGLVLSSILLSYFSPSSKFSPFLLSFLETHPHQMARDVCLPRLDKRLRHNWLTYCRKPADGKEISIVRLSITKWPQYCGVFGESLERIMSLQTCSPYLKTLRLPWILTTLAQKLIETGGAETEGIFRCAADHDLIAQLRLEIDCVDFRKITDAKQVHSLLSNVQDPHVIAGLLKLFFRQLYEPVFPVQIYDVCLESGHDGHTACRVFNERLPNLNKDVVAYLIRLLQLLAKSDKVAYTKMDNSNLSMVWAPNLLRVPEQDSMLQSGSRSGSKWSIANGSEEHHSAAAATTTIVPTPQSMIFEQTRREMQFIKCLIIHLDTSFIESVI